MTTKRVQPGPEHEAFRQEFLALLGRHRGTVSADELLATAAYSVGQLVAYQDAQRFTPQQIQQLVWENIAEGNREAVEFFIASSGGRH